MADAPAPVTPAAPAPQTAPPVATPPAAPPSPTDTAGVAETPKVQPPAQDPAVKALEARAAALAKVKREAARIEREKQEVAAQRAAASEDAKLAAEYRRLHELKLKDPVAYLTAVDLKLGEVSKAYLQQKTAKSPEQVAEEVFEKKQAAAREAQQKAELEAAEKARLAKIQNDEATYAGARKRMEQMTKEDPVRWELSSIRTSEAVAKAWETVEKFWKASIKETGVGQALDFGKALDAAERWLEAEELPRLAKSTKLGQYLEKQKAAAAEAAKAKPVEVKKDGGKDNRSVAPKNSVETEVKQSPQSKPLRPLMPRDVRRIAAQLTTAAAAKQDN
jgi:hypothetical protein